MCPRFLKGAVEAMRPTGARLAALVRERVETDQDAGKADALRPRAAWKPAYRGKGSRKTHLPIGRILHIEFGAACHTALTLRPSSREVRLH